VKFILINKTLRILIINYKIKKIKYFNNSYKTMIILVKISS
jgi:hypothetical protein